MGTKAFIGMKTNTGYRGIHCTTDGGVAGVGKMLLEHFDKEKTETLISMGNVSRLNRNFGEKHSFSNPYLLGTPEFDAESELRDSMCTFFHRDRGDALKIYEELTLDLMPKTLMHIEYVYILGEDNVWRVSDMDTGNPIQLLSDAVSRNSDKRATA